MTVAAQPTSRPRPAPALRSNITVVIPTFNEELNLPHALASVLQWAEAVHVVDSGSTDRTRDIAREAGATVTERSWLGYAAQKNWALDNLPIQTDWVFILDSDESVTPELRDEMLAIAQRDPANITESGFYVNRLTYFLGKPIRHCGYFPSYNLRLFKRGRARYEDRDVHEHMIVDGPTASLKHIMLHEDRRGLEHFIAKHNRYSTLEAGQLVRERQNPLPDDPAAKERGIAVRRWLKRKVLPRLPVSGLWRFLYMYIVRAGFLDGVNGFRFCLLLSTYDVFISLKLAEIRSAAASNAAVLPARGLAIPEGALATERAVSTPTVATHAPAAPPPAPTTIAAPAIAPLGAPATPDAPPLAEPRRHRADALERELNPTAMPPGAWPAVKSVPVSILVPVKNEQRNIVECLRRCQWATELVVVDSQSTDPTIELSQAMGADVYQFHYDRASGWPKKKNWALDKIPWKNEWVMILDADEYMTPELADEIRRVVTGQYTPKDPALAGCGDGYWVNRRFMFFGQWLRGCGYYPSWNVRLLKHKVGRYERIGTLGDTGSGDNEVHEHIVLSTGKAGYLEHEFLHYAYPDLTAWIEKHNRYTSWEAHAMEARDEGAVRARLFGEPIERRRWLKRMARGLPFRPTLRFIYAYAFQKGWRDGYAGFVMCRLLAWYEFVSIAKYRERKALHSDRARREASMTGGRHL
ncbi:MAG TPA: glycosyltransferase family 2 protein [Phycisphaerales bacterium]|nr:glycosyltransferase family 2 protein [Phycisphaerales bacterium]